MIKLAALNEDWSDESSSEPSEGIIKEARESEALELYNKALEYQQLGDHECAEEFYEKLLSASFVADVCAKDKSEDPESHPALVFKYSAYKNLASLAEEKSDLDKAIDLYLEAAAIDDSDVTLWYKIGKLAVKLANVRLARYALEQGLNCNSKHWPCLDELIVVLYAIGDYHACLLLVSSAFERDASYPKGLIVRDKIYSEYPSFRNEFQYVRGMTLAKHATYDQGLASEIFKEALDLRKRNSQRNAKVEPLPIVPGKHLAIYTWSSLGNCLVALCDQVTSNENSQTLCQKVNLACYCNIIITPELMRKSSSQKIFIKENDERSSNTCSVKRKKTIIMENDQFSAPKRRSARVSKSKKKQEEINYQEILQDFLPKMLRIGYLNEDSESIKSDFQDDRFENAGVISIQGMSSSMDCNIPNIPAISSENEPLDVQTFVKKQMANCGTLHIMCEYVLHLTNNSHFKWSVSLIDVFLKIYSKIRPHLSFPPLLCQDSSKSEIMSNAKLILVNVELTLDRWCTEKSKSSSSLSPAGSPRGNGHSTRMSPLKHDSKFHGKYFLNDLEYIAQAAGAASSLLEGDWIEFALRVNWAKVRFMMFQGKMDLAVIYLDRCKTLIELSETPITIHLVNCKADNIITVGQVRKKLESLQRCRSLEEVHHLYELEQYQEVVDVLLSSLHQPPTVTKADNGGMSIPERPAQLLLLQDSLLKLKEYKTCLLCAEVAFNEAVSQMTPCEAWSTTLERLFQCINTILSMDSTMLDSLPDDKMQRLTQNIIKVIDVSMDSTENASEVPLATVMPWLILYRIIRSKEDENEFEVMEVDEKPSITPTPESDKSETSSQSAPVTVIQVGLPLSLQFLRLGHEALGGRSWCISNDGLFLLLYVDVFLKCLKDNSLSMQRNRDKLVQELEQCFFCLYGHPSKKAKARGLQEHGSTQIPLTWSNSAVVFEFFKPQTLPTFEDKTYTVTSEVQNLLRRITVVVPQSDLQAITVESVQNFIEGTSDQIPTLPRHLEGVERPVISEIFYLLADSYFKNKEFSKAIKFYIHDICANPDRFDTWAAMALARQVRLEDKLRACEPKSEGPIKKHSISTLRCFKRALEINKSNTNLWEEYGSLSYCLHSYASRQMNQVDPPSPENQKALDKRRTDMLIQAQNCFNEALHKPDNDEPWLQCYMLGKIAEKLCKPPDEYLEFYLMAFRELDKDGAEYPRKIGYHNPPNLALEALEVAFRFHTSVLKLLLKPNTKTNYKTLEDYLDQASRCPFYQANSKVLKDDDEVCQTFPPEKGVTVGEKTESVEVGIKIKEILDEDFQTESGKTSDSKILEARNNDFETDAKTNFQHGQNESRPENVKASCNLNKDITKDLSEKKNAVVDEAEKIDVGGELLQQRMSNSDDEKYNKDITLKLIHRCLKALAYGLQRFPQHYKSQYRLAHAYLHIPSYKNASLSRDLLLGSNIVGENPFNVSVQGLFNEKSKTNLFQGIWRIPLDDVDRPGSFCTHMYKAVKLLIDVLHELHEWDSLLLVSSLMYRSPDAGKKYLRDNERLLLAAKAFKLSLKLLSNRLDEYKKLSNSCLPATTGLLTDVYEAYKCSQKVQEYAEETEKLLVEVFKLSGLHKDEIDASLLDEALKCFQQQSKTQVLTSENEETSTSKTVKCVSTEAEMVSNEIIQSRMNPSTTDIMSEVNASSQSSSQMSDFETVPETLMDFELPVLIRDVGDEIM